MKIIEAREWTVLKKAGGDLHSIIRRHNDYYVCQRDVFHPTKRNWTEYLTRKGKWVRIDKLEWDEYKKVLRAIKFKSINDITKLLAPATLRHQC